MWQHFKVWNIVEVVLSKRYDCSKPNELHLSGIIVGISFFQGSLLQFWRSEGSALQPHVKHIAVPICNGSRSPQTLQICASLAFLALHREPDLHPVCHPFPVHLGPKSLKTEETGTLIIHPPIHQPIIILFSILPTARNILCSQVSRWFFSLKIFIYQI